VVALAGCGSDAGVKEARDGKVTVAGKGARRTVTVNGEDGTTITFNQRSVPAGFPRAVPLPQGVRLQNATSGTRAGKQFFQLAYTLGSTAAGAAIDDYGTRLGDYGFSVTRPDGSGAGTLAPPLQADGSGWHVLALATDAGSGSLTLTVTEA
jgi:hypothetical protein